MLYLIEGPSGGGKSQFVGDLKAAGEIVVIADVTRLWAATGGYQRGADGKFPIRRDDDPALHLSRYLQTTAAAFALREGFNIAVTTSRRGQTGRWAALAAEHGA